MNSFNIVKKCKYEIASPCLISLNEYVIFEDEKAKQKCIVFNFYNSLVQPLYDFTIDVNQYNDDDELIATSRICFSDLKVKSNVSFTPNGRLEVLYECVKISYTLIEANFQRSIYKNGVLIDNTKNFESYIGSAYERKKGIDKKEYKKQEKENKKKYKLQKQLETKKAKRDLKLYEIRNSVDEGKTKIKDLKQVFKSEEIMNLYKPSKGCRAYLITFAILLGIGSIAGTYVYRYTSLDYSYNDYDFKLVKQSNNSYNCYLTGYWGSEKDVIYDGKSVYTSNVDFLDYWNYIIRQRETNPFEDDRDINFNISGIGDNAFKNSSIIYFGYTGSSALTMGDYAFYNASNLGGVSDSFTTIGKYGMAKTSMGSYESSKLTYCDVGAFSDNKKLNYFNAPNAKVSKDVFKGDTNLYTIAIDNVYGCETLGDLFGTTNEEIPSSVSSITIKGKNLPTGFFYGVSKNINISLSYTINNMYGDKK